MRLPDGKCAGRATVRFDRVPELLPPVRIDGLANAFGRRPACPKYEPSPMARCRICFTQLLQRYSAFSIRRPILSIPQYGRNPSRRISRASGNAPAVARRPFFFVP